MGIADLPISEWHVPKFKVERANAAGHKKVISRKKDFQGEYRVYKREKMWLTLLASLVIWVFLLYWGKAEAEIRFVPYVALGVSFTDNVDLTSDNTEHDYITTVSPGADLTLTSRRSNLSLSYIPTYASYLRFPEYNTLRHSASLTAASDITNQTQIQLSDSYLYTEDPVSDLDTTIRQGREPYYTNTTEIGIVNQFGQNDTIEIHYSYYIMKNDSSNPPEGDARTLEDTEHNRPSILLNYWLVPNRYGTETEFTYTLRDFENSEDYNDLAGRFRLIRRFGPHYDIFAQYTQEYTNYTNNGEDYSVYSPQVGFIWAEQANSSLSFSFGYYFQDNKKSEDDSGPIGTLATMYRWDEGSTLTLTGDVGYERASNGAENLGFSPFYSMVAVVSHPIARQLDGNVMTGYRRNIYTEVDPDREDTLWQFGGGLSYRMLPWITTRVDYAFRKMDSDDNRNDYVENRGTITVRLSPREPAWLIR